MLVIVNSILTDKRLVVLERIASSGSNTLCHPGKIQITHSLGIDVGVGVGWRWVDVEASN